LVDLLKYCGVQSYRQGAHHVHFNGVEKELPQGTNGSYGTSLIYGTALNPANDILIAYKHNGKLLAPDHGFPVRMIIPGGIGGRMVKWLANIEVLGTESDNFVGQRSTLCQHNNVQGYALQRRNRSRRAKRLAQSLTN